MPPRSPYTPGPATGQPPAARATDGRRQPLVVLRVEQLDDLTLPNALPVAGPLLLNQTIAGVQQEVRVAVRGDGGFVAVWDGPGAGGKEDVFARLFDATGNPVGGEFRVNVSSPGNQFTPAVAVTPAGRFVVTWVTDQGGKGTGKDILARWFDPAGTPLTGEVAVDTSTGDQVSPAVAVRPNGDAVVVWQGPGAAGGQQIFARQYAKDGTPLGGPVAVSAAAKAAETSPAVAMAANGSFVTVWADGSGPQPQIHGQRFDAAGVGQGEFAVEARPLGPAAQPAVAADGAGDFVVAWAEQGVDGDGKGVLMRRFSATGTPLTSDVLVNITTRHDQDAPAVGMDGLGNALVAWQSEPVDKLTTHKAVFARVYTADGRSGNEIQVTAGTAGDDTAPAVGVNGTGAAVVAWQGVGPGDHDGVFASLYPLPGLPLDLPPTITVDPTPASYPAGSGPLVVDAGVTVTDPDDATLAGATVEVTAAFAAGQDVLGFDTAVAAVAGITGTYDASTGTLTLTGTAPVVAYQALLRTVTYWDTSPWPSLVPRTVTFTVSDGVATAAAGRPIVIVPVNHPPIVADDKYTAAGDSVFVVAGPGVLENDTDPDGDPLTALLTTGTTHGTVVLSPDGSFVYTPFPGFSGTDTFTYRASDLQALSGVATVTITVTAVDRPPTAADDRFVTMQDTPLFVAAAGVLGNDSDPDGDPLAAALVSGPAHGTLTLTPDGAFTYTPAPGFTGDDTFTYRATDRRLSSAPATVTVHVAPKAAPPVAADDAYSTTADTPLVVTGPGVLANDRDPAGGSLTADLVSGPAHGRLTLNPDGSFTYTSDPGFTGTDHFDYRADDGTGQSSPAQVRITVRAANRPPVAVDDTATTDPVTPVAVPVLANDSDPDGDPLTVTAVGRAGHGTVAVAGSSVVYTPDPGFSGIDRFIYTVADGNGGTATATVTVTVRPAVRPPDPPTAVSDEYATAENTPLTVGGRGVLANDQDPDGDPLAAALVSGPAHGTLTLTPDGAFAYTPDPGFTGDDVFTYRATDGRESSAAVAVTIHVRAVAGPPPAGQLAPGGIPAGDSPPPAGNPPPADTPSPVLPPRGPQSTPGKAPGPKTAEQSPPGSSETPAGPTSGTTPPVFGTSAPGGGRTPLPTDSDARGDVIVRVPGGPGQAVPAGGTVSPGGFARDVWFLPTGPSTIEPPRPPEWPPAPSSGPTWSPVPTAVVSPGPAPAPSPTVIQAGPDSRPNIPPPADPPTGPAVGESPPVALPLAALTSALDELKQEVSGTAPADVTVDVGMAAGVVMSAGYVLLSPRTLYWLASAALARQVAWRAFDPLEVVYAWEEEQALGGTAEGDDESLQSMAGG